jgi:hypothetical protein
MKKILLISLAFIIGLAVVAQKHQFKNGVFIRDYQKAQAVTIEPPSLNTISPYKPSPLGLKNSDNPNIVTILELGTSANVLGYSGGTRTMVWADDDMNVLINFHRAGPGATPSNLSGYYAMDLGVNMGASQSDWTNQIIVSNALLPSTPYWYDASRYPAAGIYNPAGNTTLSNAYCAFFGPNFCNLVLSGFGGYTYGVANLVDFSDTTKHLRWWNGNPSTYIPDGFTVSTTGIAHMLEGSYNVVTAASLDSVVYGRGVWNSTTKDYDYTFSSIAFPCVDNHGSADAKIAASPDGNTLWMSVLTSLVGATPLISTSYFPVLRKSTDDGLTWSAPFAIQLDGPNGIEAILNCYSDYLISTLFNPPLPARDEIAYTTAFDHSLSVDKWGNPHIGVVIGMASATAWSISTGIDSILNVFDIYSVDDGATFKGVFLGSLTTFRGTWATYTSDNRVYTSRNKYGDKMFFTWNDTKIPSVVDNQNPDVYARGFDLITNKLTSDNGADQPNNVTFLSDITTEAYWQCTSPIVFTDNNKYTLPICTQWFADAALDSKFKYIPDFSYVDGDFTVSVANPPFPVGIDQKNNELASVTLYPNPVKDLAKVSVNLKQSADVSVELTNLVGQRVISQNKGNMNAGFQQFSIDASSLSSGVYFMTVRVNGQKFTQKMIVE